MKYDIIKCKGVQIKGFTLQKIFLNKDATYESVLQRVKEDLYETTERENVCCSLVIILSYSLLLFEICLMVVNYQLICLMVVNYQ